MFKFVHFNWKMEACKSLVFLVLIFMAASRVGSISIRQSSSIKQNFASKDNARYPEPASDNKVSVTLSQSALSEGEQSFVGLNQRQSNDTFRKLPQNEPANAADPPPSSDPAGNSQVYMSANNNVESQTFLDSDDVSPCGRHKECDAAEESRWLRLQKVKATILRKLKMDKPPNVSAMSLNSRPVQEIMRKFGLNQSQDESDFDEFASTKNILVMANRVPFANGGQPVPCCHFQFADEVRTYDVKSAFLWLHVRPSAPQNIRLVVYKYFPPLVKGGPLRQRFARSFLLHSPLVEIYRWRKFNITAIAKDWMQRPGNNYGIAISTSPRNVIDLHAAPSNENKPFLDLNLTPSKVGLRRKRNAARICTEEDGDSQCCMYDFTISFQSIGWNFIIFPSKFNARYCAGECTSQHLDNLRNKLIHHANLGNDRVSNCCVGTHLQPISMLYHNDKQAIIYSTVPDMEIKSCGCL